MSMSVSLGPLIPSRWVATAGYNQPRPTADLRVRLMTFSSLKIHLALALLLAASSSLAAPPPEAEVAAAERAVAAAERASPHGEAARMLERARGQLSGAQAAMDKRKHRDALLMAESATASADQALAYARLDAARAEVDSKAARNADLRRRLLVNRDH